MMSFEDKLEKNFLVTGGDIYCGVSVPVHWENVVYSCIEELDTKYSNYIRIAQIKEKFNRLRIYYDVIDNSNIDEKDYEIINNIIDKAEKEVEIIEEYFR